MSDKNISKTYFEIYYIQNTIVYYDIICHSYFVILVVTVAPGIVHCIPVFSLQKRPILRPKTYFKLYLKPF